ncbi:hypothetical protein AcW1_003547 [Taiwanofungus camphoratus]|nr:hypothetical protein AcW1_003547 [Antrodia cinnamomea]
MARAQTEAGRMRCGGAGRRCEGETHLSLGCSGAENRGGGVGARAHRALNGARRRMHTSHSCGDVTRCRGRYLFLFARRAITVSVTIASCLARERIQTGDARSPPLLPELTCISLPFLPAPRRALRHPRPRWLLALSSSAPSPPQSRAVSASSAFAPYPTSICVHAWPQPLPSHLTRSLQGRLVLVGRHRGLDSHSLRHRLSRRQCRTQCARDPPPAVINLSSLRLFAASAVHITQATGVRRGLRRTNGQSPVAPTTDSASSSPPPTSTSFGRSPASTGTIRASQRVVLALEEPSRGSRGWQTASRWAPTAMSRARNDPGAHPAGSTFHTLVPSRAGRPFLRSAPAAPVYPSARPSTVRPSPVASSPSPPLPPDRDSRPAVHSAPRPIRSPARGPSARHVSSGFWLLAAPAYRGRSQARAACRRTPRPCFPLPTHGRARSARSTPRAHRTPTRDVSLPGCRALPAVSAAAGSDGRPFP